MKNLAASDVAKAERERIAAINALPEAIGREGLAMHIATKTDMTVEQAKTALAAAPLSAAGISAQWDAALKSRGMTNAAASSHTPAAAPSSWDAALKSRGMQVSGSK